LRSYYEGIDFSRKIRKNTSIAVDWKENFCSVNMKKGENKYA